MSRRALWASFCLFIVYGTTIPFHFTVNLNAVREHLERITLNPLVSPETGRRVSIPDVVQNVLLFVPFGVLGMVASRVQGTIRRIGWITLLAGALSLFVEALQLFTTNRVSAVSDVAANTTGALLGAVAAGQIGAISVDVWDRARRNGLADSPAFRSWLWAGLLVLVASLEPFDITLEIGSVVTKIRALQHDVWQAGVPSDEIIAAFQYGLFGWATCALLQSTGRRRVAFTAAAIVVPIAIGLEASQILIASRMPGLGDALVRAGGALLGIFGWEANQIYPAPAAWMAFSILSTAAGSIMQQWSPFTPASNYRPMQLVPFLNYYAHTTMDGLSHAIELLLLYAPLGAVFGYVTRNRRRATALALAWTALIAIPVEFGQGWIAGRYSDVTDVGLSLVGAWFGARIATLGPQPRISPEQRVGSLPDR